VGVYCVRVCVPVLWKCVWVFIHTCICICAHLQVCMCALSLSPSLCFSFLCVCVVCKTSFVPFCMQGDVLTHLPCVITNASAMPVFKITVWHDCLVSPRVAVVFIGSRQRLNFFFYCSKTVVHWMLIFAICVCVRVFLFLYFFFSHIRCFLFYFIFALCCVLAHTPSS